jgi:hypothetical protein
MSGTAEGGQGAAQMAKRLAAGFTRCISPMTKTPSDSNLPGAYVGQRQAIGACSTLPRRVVLETDGRNDHARSPIKKKECCQWPLKPRNFS